LKTREIFEKYKSIAVVGMSANPFKVAHSVPLFMKNNGYEVIPVNPNADEIIGIEPYKHFNDIPRRIDILNVFRPSEEAMKIVREAIERRKSNGDIDVIWLQQGIYDDAARKLAEENGIVFVQDTCMLTEYVAVSE
jgi:predicted CoA-binding protein